jgi:hypothetical protein
VVLAVMNASAVEDAVIGMFLLQHVKYNTDKQYLNSQGSRLSLKQVFDCLCVKCVVVFKCLSVKNYKRLVCVV